MTSISDAEALAALGRCDTNEFLAGFSGGALRIAQPVSGYRSGADAVLLAAAVASGGSLLELGCGAGVAMLCAARRRGDLAITGIEIQPGYAALARSNAAQNAIAAEVICADIAALPADIRARRFDHVILNPPYFPPGTGKPATDAGRDLARAGAAPLATWLDAASRRLAPKGRLVLIQHMIRLRDVLAGLPSSIGSVEILPLTARSGRAPERFVLWARKGGRGALRMGSPMVLHAGPAHLSDGSNASLKAETILRFGAELSMER